MKARNSNEQSDDYGMTSNVTKALKQLADWNGSSPVIKKLALAALSQTPETDAVHIKQLALLLHAQSWLSPSYIGSHFRSRGMLQNYQERRMYERYGMLAPEIETALKQGVSNMLFRNSNFALYALWTSLLPRTAGDICVSLNVDADKRALLNQLANDRGRTVITFVSAGELSNRISDKTLSFLHEADIKQADAIRGNVAGAQQIHLVYTAKAKLTENKMLDDPRARIYGIYDLHQRYDWNDEDAGGSLLEMNFNDKGLVRMMSRTRESGGLIDSQTLWYLMMTIDGTLPMGDLDHAEDELRVNAASFGDEARTLAHFKTRYEFLLPQWEGLQIKEAGMGIIYQQGLSHFRHNLTSINEMQAGTRAFDPVVFWGIEQDYHAFLRILGNLFYERDRKKAGIQDALETRLEHEFHQDSLLFQSAMSAYIGITQFLKSLGSPRILVGNNAYYEINQSLVYYGPSLVKRIDEYNLDQVVADISSGQYSAYLMDPIANAMPDQRRPGNKASFPAFNIREMMVRLTGLTYDKPFYLVMDTSVLGPTFDFSRYTAGLIIPPNLHFIQVNSLQKFYEEGQELSTGGAITVTSAGGKEDMMSQLRAIRAQTGGRLSTRQLQLLSTLGFNKDIARERTERIHRNALDLARFLEEEISKYPEESIKLVFPGIQSHPDYEIGKRNFNFFGPFVFLSVGSVEQNERFDDILRQKMAEKGAISYLKNSFGFAHFASFSYFAGQIYRYCAGEEDEKQMALIKESFREALIDVFENQAMMTPKRLAVQKKNRYEQLLGENPEPFPTTIRLMNDLTVHGVPIGVGSASVFAEQILTKLNVRHTVNALVDGHAVHNDTVLGKPHPAFFQSLADKMGIDPKDMVLFEDAVSGVQSAKAAGFGLVIGLARENNAAELKAAGADIVWTDIADVTVDKLEKFLGKTLKGVVFDMDVISEIKENSVPGKQGVNDFRRENYGGPCPPSGTHRYFFKIYALDTKLNLNKGISKKELEKSMQGHILQQAQLVGLYER